ncbi:MAG: flagellar biosynthesis protein FlhA, partial [Chromatiales bacterium]|nr:flagellar biosynthesis protein FlhA [Chromatiales bacterium]
ARFTLDAMPGKQMAIDADLNAGLLTQEEARNRRAEIGREADFYGSMDGASKFVRGDAIAGILILVINIIGGLSIGMIQHGLSFGDASRNYILLTIGDGLVAQIPALLLSTATAIIVTRVSSSNDMGQQVLSQLLGDPRALYVAAGVMGGMGLIPGMPNLAFLSLAALAGGGAWWMNREKSEEAVAVAEQQAASMKPPSPEVKELTWDDVQPVDIIGLEVGYRLIPLVDKNQGGQLMQRIKGVRKKLSQELGFLIQPVHIRDNLELQANAYRITLMGVNVGESQIQPDKELAIDPGKVFGTLSGSHTTDPAFGLKAVWIEPGQKDYAQTLNYTVVDPSTVVATHLSQILQNHANELIGHEEVQQLMESLSRSAPKLVEDLVPKLLTHGQILKVLQNLLEEGIPVRDMRTIAETLAEHAAKSQDADVLTSAVRSSLGRMIVQQIVGTAPELEVFTLDPPLEQLLLKSLQAGAGDGISIDPESADRMLSMLGEAAGNQEAVGKPAVLLVNPAIRAKLSRFLRYSIGSLKVLAYTEIPADRQVRMIQSIGIQG